MIVVQFFVQNIQTKSKFHTVRFTYNELTPQVIADLKAQHINLIMTVPNSRVFYCIENRDVL